MNNLNKRWTWKGMSTFSPVQCDEARHLLRAILRECTYLPDRQARLYLAGHAVNRFRDYTPGTGNKSDSIILERRSLQLAQGRKALSELCRANAGQLKPLQKLLHLTYGRVGKRRHELMQPLLHTPDAVDSADKEKHQIQSLPQISPQHRALLVSQMQASPPRTTRKPLRTLALKIPEKNNWGRPMPQNRVTNMIREWYANILERTLVPLPETEWNRLRDLAVGTIKFKGPIPRRPLSPSQTWKLSPLEITLGVAPVNTPQSVVHTSSNPVHGHTLTPRYMRRLWASVFAQCPCMTWNSHSQKWVVKWGCDVLTQEQIKRATIDVQ